MCVLFHFHKGTNNSQIRLQLIHIYMNTLSGICEVDKTQSSLRLIIFVYGLSALNVFKHKRTQKTIHPQIIKQTN